MHAAAEFNQINHDTITPYGCGSPEASTLCETSLATSRRAQHCTAAAAQDHSLRMAEDRGDLEAASTLYVHKVAVGGLNEPLKLVLLKLQSFGRAAG